MAELMLGLAQSACIRGMRVDGMDYFSVYDFIIYVCDKEKTYATTLWSRLISSDSLEQQEIWPHCFYLKFSGQGQKSTPCMTMCGLQVLLQVMGGKVSAQYRNMMRSVFNRYMAGDTSMLTEIEANAASDAPIHAAYRRVLSGDIPVCPPNKRRRLEPDTANINNFIKTQHHRALSRLFCDDSFDCLGCSAAEFRTHIEHKMAVYNRTHKEQLSWANIHLDHIKPIASVPPGCFDARVLHYTNIQPLSAKDNLAKGARWSKKDQVFWQKNIIHNPKWQTLYMPRE